MTALATPAAVLQVASEIVRETRELSARLRTELAGAPDAELLCWLQVAVQREAMVSYLYGAAPRDRRLGAATSAAGRVAADVLTLIWQQETSHAATLAARVADGVFAGRPGALDAVLARIGGTLDGVGLDWLTDGDDGLRRTLARAAAWLGKRLGIERVPDFALDIPSADLRSFFVLARALELTARESYARMGELLPEIARTSPSIQPQGLIKPLRDTELDEQFHERVFDQIGAWFSPDGEFDRSLTESGCVGILKQLLVDTTGVQVRAPGIRVTSDGGLGPLFRRHNIEIIIVERRSS